MKRRDFLGFGAAAGGAMLLNRSGAAVAATKFDFAKLRPQIDDKVTSYMSANRVPGVAIGVAYRDPGGPLQQEYFHYGVASKATGTAMDESSIVLINSITKVFTSALLAIAVQRGLMSLSDPIQDYLPEITVPSSGDRQITLEHLASHRSGLPRDFAGMLGDKTGEALLKFVAGYKLTRQPGGAYEYSNVGYGLLGLILTRRLGAPFGDLVTTEIAAPLEMPDTYLVVPEEQNGRVAQGYRVDGIPAQLRPPSVYAPTADLLSTTPDLVKLLTASIDLESTPLGPAFTPMFKIYGQARGRGGIGLGWEIDDAGTPNEAFWKSGVDLGATSEIWFSRELNYGFITLTNRGIENRNGQVVPESWAAGAIGVELRRILTAAARA